MLVFLHDHRLGKIVVLLVDNFRCVALLVATVVAVLGFVQCSVLAVALIEVLVVASWMYR